MRVRVFRQRPLEQRPVYPTFVVIARDDVRAKFQVPVTTLGHGERAKHVTAVLEHLQQLVMRLARNHEI